MASPFVPSNYAFRNIPEAGNGYTTGGGFGGGGFETDDGFGTPALQRQAPMGFGPDLVRRLLPEANLQTILDLAPFLTRTVPATRRVTPIPGGPFVPQVSQETPVPQGVLDALTLTMPGVLGEVEEAAPTEPTSQVTPTEDIIDARTNTPEFRDWFGESKVVNEAGRPLTVYHGTPQSGFTSFDTYGSKYGLMGQGSYFTEDPAVASAYSEKGLARLARQGVETSQGVYPVYLTILNPIDMDAPANPEEWFSAFRSAPADIGPAHHFEGMTNEQAFNYVEEALSSEYLPDYEVFEIMQDGLRSMKYDGITHLGGGRITPGSTSHRVWIAFDPEQIKSIYNPGTWSKWKPGETWNPVHADIMKYNTRSAK